MPAVGSSSRSSFGSAREGPGDLEAALVAVGQVSGQLVVTPAEAHVAEPVPRPLVGFGLFAPLARQAEHCVERAGAEARVHADEDVLDGGHVAEQADVLERAPDAEGHDVAGPGAPEDAHPIEQPYVPAGPDDGREERGDEQSQRHQDEDLGEQVETARAGDQPEQQHQEWQDEPEERLGPRPHRPRNQPPVAELDGPIGRLEQTGDDVEERRLAGAVGPDQADDRALRDVEVDGPDGDEPPEPLRDPAGVKDQAAARRGGRRGHRLGGHDPVASRVSELANSAASSVTSRSSRRRLRLGKRPSGLSSIISTRARP